MVLDDKIAAIVRKHALAAQSSQYDRTVMISAIAAARRVIDDFFASSKSDETGEGLLDRLAELQSNYNDPDGIYTNGKGVLGSLIGDVAAELSNDAS